MSPRDFELDLTRPTQSGVYFVGVADLDRLSRLAARDELHVSRTDLAGCHTKQELLRRMTLSLQLPPGFGDNWDALADCLRDLGRMPAWGRVLLFEHADEMRRAAEVDFDVLLGILDDAATFASEHDVPWFALLSLPDGTFDESPIQV
ncbi:MAG: barstar family protein [Rhodanobacter sp.]